MLLPLASSNLNTLSYVLTSWLTKYEMGLILNPSYTLDPDPDPDPLFLNRWTRTRTRTRYFKNFGPGPGPGPVILKKPDPLHP